MLTSRNTIINTLVKNTILNAKKLPIQHRSFFNNFNTPKDENKPIPVIGENYSLKISFDNLNSNYRWLQSGLRDKRNESLTFFTMSPLASFIWLTMTEQVLFESPVALSILAVGIFAAMQSIMQYHRLNKYGQFSAIAFPQTITNSYDTNHTISQLLAGHPKLRFNSWGLQVKGTIGDLNNPTTFVSDTLRQIELKKRIVLPSSVLTNNTFNLANNAHDRWLSRITAPLAIINLILIASKDAKDRKIDDYVVGAAAAYSIYDYFEGESVADARKKFTNALKHCTTPKQVIKVLIDHRILDSSMRFLSPWIANQDQVGVRISRASNIVLEKDRKYSLCGPYPLKLFPEKVYKKEDNDENQLTSLNRNNRS